jgi:hypothetical protein
MHVPGSSRRPQKPYSKDMSDYRRGDSILPIALVSPLSTISISWDRASRVLTWVFRTHLRTALSVYPCIDSKLVMQDAVAEQDVDLEASWYNSTIKSHRGIRAAVEQRIEVPLELPKSLSSVALKAGENPASGGEPTQDHVLGKFSVVPAGLVLLATYTQHSRAGLFSAVPAGLKPEPAFSRRHVGPRYVFPYTSAEIQGKPYLRGPQGLKPALALLKGTAEAVPFIRTFAHVGGFFR